MSQLNLFRTAYNDVAGPDDDEVPHGPDMCVPDQSMSVQEILRRYASGLPLGGGLGEPIYEGEDEDNSVPENFHKWDLADQQEYREQNAEKIERLKERLAEESKAPVTQPELPLDEKP